MNRRARQVVALDDHSRAFVADPSELGLVAGQANREAGTTRQAGTDGQGVTR